MIALNVFSNQQECQKNLQNHSGKSTTYHRKSYGKIWNNLEFSTTKFFFTMKIWNEKDVFKFVSGPLTSQQKQNPLELCSALKKKFQNDTNPKLPKSFPRTNHCAIDMILKLKNIQTNQTKKTPNSSCSKRACQRRLNIKIVFICFFQCWRSPPSRIRCTRSNS